MPRKAKKKLNIQELMLDSVFPESNLAELMDSEWLEDIGRLVLEEFDRDDKSRSEWDDAAKKAIELAKLEHKKKNDPWPNASNVKFPMITNAVIQFGARTIPEIVRGGKVVEVAITGKPTDEKEQRAKRVAQHMSYQLLIESDDWEAQTDKLVHLVATVGTAHKKTYFDPILGHNRSELVHHEELIINQEVKSLEKARRISHVLDSHQNDLIEQMRAKIFRKIDIEDLPHDDEEGIHELIEQHRFLDLDDDGYEEPYIVTIHKESQEVLRIIPRFEVEGVLINDENEIVSIDPVHYFTDFHLIPSVDGSYWSLGFGTLMFSLNEAVNTNINQLIDSGTLANMQGGFIGKGLRIKGGIMRHRPGEWKFLDSAIGTDIKNNIVPVAYKEPSIVLFQLLGLLIDAGKDIASLSDVLTGQQPAQNVPATTVLALVEQGMKVFNSIQKRLHVGFKKEFSKLYRLNRIFLDPEVYFRVMDEDVAIKRSDYEVESFDIHPVSDPTLSSDAQRLARSNALLELKDDPRIDGREVLFRYVEDLNAPNAEKLVPPPNPNAPPPPELIKMASEIEEGQKKLELKAQEIRIKEQTQQIGAIKAMAEVEKIRADALLSIANAEAAEAGSQIEAYKAQLETLKPKGGTSK